MSETESEDKDKINSNNIKINTDQSIVPCDSSNSAFNTLTSESDTKSKMKTRGRKRKRVDNSSSSESESILPENALEMEKNLHASALKNNLDHASVKKILKTVVTNDHVLAFVQLREEEEAGESSTEENIRPKLTRAKVKELMKVSPKSAPWSLELTPIKHIPIKTRPEVKALIAQELPDDEDDDEYQPTHDDVPSDDDHTLESCSDVDSLPRTPATPRPSPRVVKDGPFKVPQELTTTSRRKLDLDEEATIALRTRSKLSLSATPIEHIESSFVPPDDVPTVDVDDPVWNEFLEECLNPAETSNARNEDDEEADPEYNVAADPDANDEDEALENSIIKISKKELNDLVTELFSIMPEATTEDELAADLANKVLNDAVNNPSNSLWEGKQEPVSDEDNTNAQKSKQGQRITSLNYSIGKSEQQVLTNAKASLETSKQQENASDCVPGGAEAPRNAPCEAVPPPVLRALRPRDPPPVLIKVTDVPELLPEQILIFQQQLRQHVQLAASNFLQLFAHPEFWSYAPHFKEYLVTLNNLAAKRADSVVNVCNLKSALELVLSWEKSISEPTPENNELVSFVKSQCERSRQRQAGRALYVGEFHNTLKEVVANSTVFLYPYLLPAMPFRYEVAKRFRYLRTEDELISLGLEQFWAYVEMNPKLFPTRKRGAHRFGLKWAVRLLCRHMLPWCQPPSVLGHVHYVRAHEPDNPINKFFLERKVEPYKHKLYPYNPKLTLYEQPEYEMPRIWLRHLAKTSKRFRDYLYKRTNVTGMSPHGVEVVLGEELKPVEKQGQYDTFLRRTRRTKTYIDPADLVKSPPKELRVTVDKVEVDTSGRQPTIVVHGVDSQAKTVDSLTEPICSTEETSEKTTNKDTPNGGTRPKCDYYLEHCTCCVLLRKICRIRQRLITDYFRPRVYDSTESCPCRSIDRPRMTNKLRLLLKYYKSRSMYVHKDMKLQYLLCNENRADLDYDNIPTALTELDDLNDPHDTAAVTSFMVKLQMRLAIIRNSLTRKSVYLLFWKFEEADGDVSALATALEKLFDVELVDMFKEFLRFLTPEQADKIGKFKDHFTQASASELVKRISEEVTEKSKRQALLARLIRSFTDSRASPCETCSDLLQLMDGYQQLANYTFGLFAHRTSVRKKLPPTVSPAADDTSAPREESDPEESGLKICNDDEDVSLQYDTDESSSLSGTQNVHDDDIDIDEGGTPLKMEIDEVDDETDDQQVGEKLNHTQVSPTKKRNDTDGSDVKIELVLSDEESVKTEAPEWQRYEDKLILEILKNRVTREERQNKTILDILEEKEVMQMITDSLSHKSAQEVMDRVMYLIELLVLSENKKLNF